MQTDKPYYYTGDRVYISRVVTYNDYPTQYVGVVIVVRLSGSTGSPYYQRTTTTDQNGMYNDNFPIAGPNAIMG